MRFLPYFFIPMLAATASGLLAPLALALSTSAANLFPSPGLLVFLACS
jgi:hypothetical protein